MPPFSTTHHKRSRYVVVSQHLIIPSNIHDGLQTELKSSLLQWHVKLPHILRYRGSRGKPAFQGHVIFGELTQHLLAVNVDLDLDFDKATRIGTYNFITQLGLLPCSWIVTPKFLQVR